MVVRSFLRGAGVVALATAGCAAPALASDAANGGSLTTMSSASFAGYTAQNCDYACPRSVSATATFTVPKLRCSSADQAIAPSVGTPSRYAGRRRSEAALFVGCYGGKAHYWPVLAVNGSVKNYPAKAAHAGDTIVLRLASDGAVSVTDETHRFKVSRTSSGGGQHRYDPWIGDEGWVNSHHHLEGVPDFGTLTYSKCKINGANVFLFFTRFNRASGGTLQIKTGPFFNGGKSFRTYFEHA